MSRSNLVRLSVLTLSTLGTSSSFAKIKTDGEWRGTGGLALSSTSGNSTSTALALNADMARATTRDKITLGASSTYARSKANGTTSTNTVRLRYFFGFTRVQEARALPRWDGWPNPMKSPSWYAKRTVLRPNPSLKPSPNGKAPGQRYSAGLLLLQRWPGALPPVPA